jgi:hypothetical protein
MRIVVGIEIRECRYAANDHRLHVSGPDNGQPFPSINQMDKPKTNADGTNRRRHAAQSDAESAGGTVHKRPCGGGEAVGRKELGHVCYWADCVAKLFLPPERAILIQDWVPTRNVDSRNCSSRFDYCQPHGVVEGNSAMPDTPNKPRLIRFPDGTLGFDVPEPTPEEIARRQWISTKCGHVKRDLRRNKLLTGKTLSN